MVDLLAAWGELLRGAKRVSPDRGASVSMTEVALCSVELTYSK